MTGIEPVESRLATERSTLEQHLRTGPQRDRTADLLDAIEALSQLS